MAEISGKSLGEHLVNIKELLNLAGENVFKIRAFDKASQIIFDLSETEVSRRIENNDWSGIPGIGKGISEVLTQYSKGQTSTAYEELKKVLSPELIEISRVSGLGPKKAKILIEKLGLSSLRDLEYACKENRLVKIPGFGEKLQAKILEGVVFLLSTEGQQRLSDAFEFAEEIFKQLKDILHTQSSELKISETGDLRRRLEILKSYDFLIEIPAEETKAKRLYEKIKTFENAWKKSHPQTLPIQIEYSKKSLWGWNLARLTGTNAHWKALGSPKEFESLSEDLFFEKLGLPFIPPEVRETGEEIKLAKNSHFETLLPWDGVTGVFHNHSTRSDGRDSLEDMVIAAKNLGYKYFGISDHSQSAFYAQGLKVNSLLEQEKEVRKLQEKYPEIRIFWGIESDILQDGSLDYDDKTLKKFDFVVASVHSRFKSDRKEMTQRILKALRHPSTRFLGHATGRLLLGRPEYECDMPEIIKCASQENVAIEINANPQRLDIDWRWGGELRKNKTLVSVNPDAHEVSGLKDVKYGVAVARKAMLPVGQVINARSLREVEAWLARKA